MKLRYALSVWRTIKQPGLAPIMRDWMAYLRMNFLYAALESGLLEALSTRATKEQLVAKLKVQRPELLDGLLDMGLALKELAVQDGLYGLRGKRSKVLATPEGDSLAAVIQASETYYHSAYQNLTDRMRGAPLGDDLKDIGETVARFSKIGEHILKNFLQTLVPRSDPFNILDIGCGSGFVLNSVWKINPEATGVGIDTDDMVAGQAAGNLKKWGIQDSFSILTGDIRDRQKELGQAFNLVTAFNILYYFSMEERTGFFSILRSLLSSKGCVAFVNNFQSRGKDAGAANLNIVNCSLNGLTGLPSLEDTETQLTSCGFSRVRAMRIMPRSEFYGITAHA
jgi:predicted O-methyltransferase YrrM